MSPRETFLHHIKAVLNPGLSREGKTERALVVLICIVCFLILSMKSNWSKEVTEGFNHSTYNRLFDKWGTSH